MKSSLFSWFIIMIIFLIVQTNNLQSQVTNIGKIESWEKTGDGLEGKTKTAYFKIMVYNAHIIRVRVSMNEEMDDFSYVLTERKNSVKDEFTINEDGGSIRLLTDAIDMEIEKVPAFRVIFRNKQ
jgi:hypothetical protein